CGFTRYASRLFGDEFQDNFFACLFNLHKVTRHVLAPIDAPFKSRDSDFLSSDNTDFHPTDVLEDADGSLLVVDTGGWFRIGCPTSQIAKSHLLGGIYPVRTRDAKKVEDPRGLAKDWKKTLDTDLVKYLEDPRFAVRQRVEQEILRN